MATPLVQDLLKRGIRHPVRGDIVRFPLTDILIQPGLLESIDQTLKRYFPGISSVAVVSDVNTHAAAADRIERQLTRAYEVGSILLPRSVRPGMKEVRHIHSMISDADLLIAVGSGTINDLAKFASHTAGKPYAVFATAPSMNGYASANASIEEENGFKTTLAAHMPQLILMDTHFLSSAPKRLVASGVGDSLCRSTAQLDWMLSYFLLGTEYLSTPFEWLVMNERRLFPSLDRLQLHYPEATELLCENLILSGLGMFLCGGSYPASQGEHLIAHLMEMRHGKELPRSFHGEQIAVTTLTMAKLQEEVLETPPTFAAHPLPDSWFEKRFGAIAGQCIAEYRKKEITPERAHGLNQRVEHFWPEMVTQMKKAAVPSDVLESALLAAGAPTRPEDIGWPADLYEEAVRDARFIRSRFTFLDLVGSINHA